MIMSSKYPTTASNSASEAEELKNMRGLGVVANNSFFKKCTMNFLNMHKCRENSTVKFPSSLGFNN